MKIEELKKALQYFVIAVPESEEQAKAYFWARKGISALRSTPHPVKPLTLDQLREMDGQPAWCEEVGKWALVSVSDAGKWKGIPFALFEENGARFEWNIEGRELSLYSYPPAHIDRSEWEKCELCSLTDGKPASRLILAETCNGEAKYCPRCGRPLTEEAWAELERRLRG